MQYHYPLEKYGYELMEIIPPNPHLDQSTETFVLKKQRGDYPLIAMLTGPKDWKVMLTIYVGDQEGEQLGHSVSTVNIPQEMFSGLEAFEEKLTKAADIFK